MTPIVPATWGRRLPRSFYARDPLELAPDLLNKVLVHDGRAGRVVEVEAYRGADDPASHAYRGLTPRTATMFGPAGRLYVYFTYGMHWCANVVGAEPGVAGAVLLRALEPLHGVEAMRRSRPRARREVDLTNGPAKLCQALGIDGGHDGTDLTDRQDVVALLDDGTDPPTDPCIGARIGISAAVDRPWRFCVGGSRHVSRPLPAATESETAEDRADVVDEATAIVGRMVDEIETDLPDDEEDLEVLEQWIADWRVYIGDRQSYADRLRADEAAQFEVTENERVFRGVDDTIRNFADVNNMPDCAVPGDVG